MLSNTESKVLDYRVLRRAARHMMLDHKTKSVSASTGDNGDIIFDMMRVTLRKEKKRRP